MLNMIAGKNLDMVNAQFDSLDHEEQKRIIEVYNREQREQAIQLQIQAKRRKNFDDKPPPDPDPDQAKDPS